MPEFYADIEVCKALGVAAVSIHPVTGEFVWTADEMPQELYMFGLEKLNFDAALKKEVRE